MRAAQGGLGFYECTQPESLAYLEPWEEIYAKSNQSN